jgi:hypothetical protein
MGDRIRTGSRRMFNMFVLLARGGTIGRSSRVRQKPGSGWLVVQDLAAWTRCQVRAPVTTPSGACELK